MTDSKIHTMAMRARKRPAALLSLAGVLLALVVAGCGSATGSSGGTTGYHRGAAPATPAAPATKVNAPAAAAVPAPAGKPPAATTPPRASSAVPQHNGGDADPDNNGGPDDGDGGI